MINSTTPDFVIKAILLLALNFFSYMWEWYLCFYLHLIKFFFVFFCLFFGFVFVFLGPQLVAYGGSQARGRIWAIAAGLYHRHSNAGSEPSLQPTPQLRATPNPSPTERRQNWSYVLMDASKVH